LLIVDILLLLYNTNIYYVFVYSYINTPKVTNRNYVEAHHLIPIRFQEQFTYSLDVPPNIVSLCPNCHSLFHHAIDSESGRIITQFTDTMKDELEVFGIPVSVSQLLNMYKES